MRKLLVIADNGYKESGIYRILGPTGVYIGSASRFDKRWYEHKRCLRLNKHHSQRLQRAWNKYGENAFEFSIIDFVEKENLVSKEQEWIDDLFAYIEPNAIYNVSKSSRHPVGIKLTEEQRKARSESMRGKKSSIEAKTKISKSLIGNTRSLGYKYDTAERDRTATGHSGGKKYTFISPNGEIYIDVINVRRFCEENNILSRKTLIMVAKGQYKQCKGWTGFIQND